MSSLDIVIPVYNEGSNIRSVLDELSKHVRTPFRVLICYDHDDDNTLEALEAYEPEIQILRVKNKGIGALGAVVTGFGASTAQAVMMSPADDSDNAPVIDAMVERIRGGAEIVVGSRFIPGGEMTGCPWLKAVLVRTAAMSLHYLARLPTRDPTNGLRMFSRKVIDTIEIESTKGFAYSLELLVKCHRRGWNIAEVPVVWVERTRGESRFKIFGWMGDYLRWYTYAFATTYLIRGPVEK